MPRWRSLLMVVVWDLHKFDSTQCASQVQAAMRALMLAERDSKPTTLAQDEAMAASAEETGKLGDRAALALQFRIEKKRVLAAAIAGMG